MKKLLSLFVVVFLSLSMFAQTSSIHVAEAGTLINVDAGRLHSSEKVIITGKLNGDDVDYFRTEIRENSPKNLKSIDLKNVSFVAGGTYYVNWEPYTTEDNLLPHYLFYNLYLENYLNEVILPANITAIGSHAFYDCKNITSIIVPEGVTHIHPNAFENCEKLASVSLSQGLKEIGKEAFKKCVKLEALTLPSGLTSINDRAFSNCEELTSIKLAEGLKSIGVESFQHCKKLKSIVFPQSLTHIGEQAFYNCDLNAVIIPENVTSIGYGVFYGCKNLVSATLPDNMTSIPDGIFLGSGIQTLKFSPNLVSIGAEAFASSGIKTINIPETVTSIGANAFSASDLESITLPDNLTSVAKGTFRNCQNLTTRTLPKQLTSVGEMAFFQIDNIKEIHVRNAVPPQADALIFSTNFSSSFNTCVLYVPVGAKNAYKKADQWENFYRIYEEGYTAQALNIHVETAGSLPTVLGESANIVAELKISGKLNGTDIKLIREMIKEAYLSSLDIEEAQIVAGGEAYYSVNGIDYFTQNDVISEFMFYSLAGLHKIVLPKSLAKVGDKSINNCINLSSIILPKGLTSIGEYAFTNNKGLKTIDIPETVTEIKIGAFAQCGIQSITLPKNLKSIEKQLFYWSQSLKAITIPEGITSIGIEAFKMCWALEEVNLPSSLQTIGTEAFFGCGKVKEILLPEGLTTIESGAFNSWGELVEIRIPNSVTTIGKSAFSGTSSLQSANLPEGLTRIEAQLFQHSGLPKITIPASVTSIGDNAFWSSTHPLEEIHVNNATPPQCERATFISSCYHSAKLYVPKGSLEAYRSAYIWQNFKNIEEEEILSIDTQSPDEATTVIGRQGEIVINAEQPAQVAVFTLTGVQVLTTRIDEGENTIALQSGLYIVKVGMKAHKVIVR